MGSRRLRRIQDVVYKVTCKLGSLGCPAQSSPEYSQLLSGLTNFIREMKIKTQVGLQCNSKVFDLSNMVQYHTV